MVWSQYVKAKLTLNKPAYAGMCIWHLSEVLTYEFHYDYIKNKYGNNSRFLFTHTDNLINKLKQNVYEDFSKDKEIFEFTNCSVESKYYDDTNKLIVDKMQDETGGALLKNLLDWSQRCINSW